ncbi:hypothetical protein C3489_20245 [Streptomyces sp. Ru71]|uniref:hypothetical protein n=1 Tax=Streptomyces sp. Ru71 TaxID=2080746 RepID=UPI000CDDAFFC|nr:hypothetical protein [Streptomyces sp. Ru71]POX51315.1 hypothetical protein C3489_20245 [Streptomyces sp. Ru71]
MRAPRTLRTALVAAGVTAALGASAAGAFAAPPAPAAQAAAPAAPAHSPHPAERVYVKTVKLADKVSLAKVFRTGKHRYEAEIWAKGVKYGTLVAHGKPAHGRSNGLHVTLRPNGTVTSWVERAKPKPVVKRVLVASAPLADGVSTARIYKVTAHHHEADIYAHGVRMGTLVADGRAAYGEHNGLHIVLRPDGRIGSWLDRTPAPAPQPDDDPQDEPTAADAPRQADATSLAAL